jgi:hypothetical protein
VKKGWKPAEGSATSVIASVRNGAPLAIDKKLGEGRVVAFLTSAAPHWNNWARDNPSFVVTMLELESYLSAGRQSDPSKEVGTPLTVPVDTQRYQEQVEFLLPVEGTADKVVIKAQPQEKGPPLAMLPDTNIAGIYEAQLTANDGTQEVKAVAYNVDAAEGDLKTIGREQLASELKDVVFDFRNVSQLAFDSKDAQGTNLSEPLLYALIFLLAGEQLLAYSASYHPARLEGVR